MSSKKGDVEKGKSGTAVELLAMVNEYLEAEDPVEATELIDRIVGKASSEANLLKLPLKRAILANSFENHLELIMSLQKNGEALRKILEKRNVLQDKLQDNRLSLEGDFGIDLKRAGLEESTLPDPFEEYVFKHDPVEYALKRNQRYTDALRNELEAARLSFKEQLLDTETSYQERILELDMERDELTVALEEARSRTPKVVVEKEPPMESAVRAALKKAKPKAKEEVEEKPAPVDLPEPVKLEWGSEEWKAMVLSAYGELEDQTDPGWDLFKQKFGQLGTSFRGEFHTAINARSIMRRLFGRFVDLPSFEDEKVEVIKSSPVKVSEDTSSNEIPAPKPDDPPVKKEKSPLMKTIEDATTTPDARVIKRAYEVISDFENRDLELFEKCVKELGLEIPEEMIGNQAALIIWFRDKFPGHSLEQVILKPNGGNGPIVVPKPAPKRSGNGEQKVMAEDKLALPEEPQDEIVTDDVEESPDADVPSEEPSDADNSTIINLDLELEEEPSLKLYGKSPEEALEKYGSARKYINSQPWHKRKAFTWDNADFLAAMDIEMARAAETVTSN